MLSPALGLRADRRGAPNASLGAGSGEPDRGTKHFDPDRPRTPDSVAALCGYLRKVK